MKFATATSDMPWGKMSQLEWEEEFRRRLIEAEYQYEVLDTEERFREELRLMDLKSLERERREKAFEAGQLSIDEEEAQDEEDEVDSPLYDLISWIGNMMFPESCFSRERSCWVKAKFWTPEALHGLIQVFALLMALIPGQMRPCM